MPSEELSTQAFAAPASGSATARDLRELLELRDDLERLGERAGLPDAAPRLDLLDLGEAYQLVLEVPGVPQERLEIAVQGRSLSVAGFREPQEGTLLLNERPSGPFERRLELPSAADGTRSQAQLRARLLVVTLPKAGAHEA